jgi:uncharacterized protein (DUF433 family)
MVERNIVEAFTERAVSRLTGLTARQLQYWDGEGFFRPSIKPTDPSAPRIRLYSFRDIVALKVLDRLRNREQVPLQHLREVKKKLMALGDDAWAATKLHVHNKRVTFVNPDTHAYEEVVSGQGVLEIALKVESEDVRQSIDRLRQRDTGNVGKVSKTRNVAQNQTVIAGTRIPVQAVKAFAKQGYTVERIMREYPTLTREDICAAIDYVAAA